MPTSWPRRRRARDVTPHQNSRLTCTVPEAGRLLGIGRDAAYRAAAKGEIPTLRLGRRLVVPLAQLELLLGGDLSSGRGQGLGLVPSETGDQTDGEPVDAGDRSGTWAPGHGPSRP
ncbi:helix-turn-helix domain-containing protein [Humibacillus xanthopallidus]|uniref:helix-turn-helix domain-containing protein n=1 Tax=Humibacillus xanthopallidus TaxID=412689 RepID=UPI00384FA828